MTQFLTSRAGSPAPFRPIRSHDLNEEDLEALDSFTGSNDAVVSAKRTPNGSVKPTVDIDALTKQAESQ